MTPEQHQAIGIDLGGTKILAGLVAGDGSVRELSEAPTPLSSPESLMEAVEHAVGRLVGNGVEAVGVGVPAQVDPVTGLARGGVNVPLDGIAVERDLADRFDLPIAVVNDATAATFAEFRLGAGRGCTDVVMLTLGTGVGGGVVSGGRLLRGHTELGHIVIVEGGAPCQGTCEGHGHVETYCSGTAARALAKEAFGPDATAQDLIDAAHPALHGIGVHLGTAIASFVNVFAPQRVIVGGGFGLAAGELLLGPAREVVAIEALPTLRSVEIVPAELGSYAGLIGAALLGLEEVAGEEI